MDLSASALIARRGTFVLDVPVFRADSGGTALLGPNGAGKTTLLLALQGLIDADGVVTRPERAASVFARPAVLRGSVLWNVAVARESALGDGRAEARRRARVAVCDVALDEHANADARTLSTGQRQRLALARALAIEPAVLFLDEPFANVDADARPTLRALVRKYVERTGCVVVLATSFLADAAALCRDVIVLRGGRVAHAGGVSSLPSAVDGYARALVEEATPPL